MWRAIEAARRTDALEIMGVAAVLQTVVGVGFVEFLGDNYLPDPEGVAALIVGAVEGYVPGEFGHSDIIDLVAVEIEGERSASRLGIAAALGQDAIEEARWNGQPLKIMTPLEWLRGPAQAAAIIDFSRAANTRQGLDPLLMNYRPLAARLHAAFARPRVIPTLLVPAGHDAMKGRVPFDPAGAAKRTASPGQPRSGGKTSKVNGAASSLTDVEAANKRKLDAALAEAAAAIDKAAKAKREPVDEATAQAEIERLAGLKDLPYGLVRKASAAKLGLAVGHIDKLVRTRRHSRRAPGTRRDAAASSPWERGAATHSG